MARAAGIGGVGLACLALTGCAGLAELFGPLQTGGNKDPQVHAYNAAGPIPLASSDKPLTTASVTRQGEAGVVGDERLVVDIDGKHYDLPLREKIVNPTAQAWQAAYHNGAGQDPSDITTMAVEFSRQYASFIILGDGYAWDGSDTPASVTSFATVATGTLETPAGNLPAQIVNYGGVYVLGIGSQMQGVASGGVAGTFTAVADFNAGTVSFLTDNGAVGSASIVGSRFGGTFTADSEQMAMNGQLAGGFYGPAAEELSGVAGGTATNKSTSETAEFAAGFLGWQNP